MHLFLSENLFSELYGSLDNQLFKMQNVSRHHFTFDAFKHLEKD